jgi:hypothetical protein
MAVMYEYISWETVFPLDVEGKKNLRKRLGILEVPGSNIGQQTGYYDLCHL